MPSNDRQNPISVTHKKSKVTAEAVLYTDVKNVDKTVKIKK